MTPLRASVTVPGDQAGDPATVLIDGADTPITANGLADYVPTAGDRLLVGRVGNQVEVLQFLSRGTVPYIDPASLSDLQANVDNLNDTVAANGTLVSTTNDTLNNYMSSNDAVVSGLQNGYDVLTGFGDAGVEEDYFWVGDDPALSTTKLVQISTYVQAGLYAGDSATLSAYFDLWNQADIGDITFSGSVDPPMTTFYNVFTANGLLAEPWNA